MNFEELVHKRQSVRKFRTEKITKEELNKILSVANLAPTAKNLQPQKIYVVETEEGLNKIDLCSPCRYNAPLVLIVCGNKNIAFSKDNHSTYEIDASIVATHIILEAANINIGSVWVEMFDKEKIKELFNLGDGIEPVCIIPLGYQADDYMGSPTHSTKKDLNEIVEYV